MTFNSDLALGKEYEKKALALFDYETYKISEGEVKEYDIDMTLKNGKNIKIEVKCDRLAKKTGNIVIEYMYNGKDSGINSTQADYWIYFIIDDNCYYKFPVKRLRKLVKECKSISGGYNKRSNMYLLNIKTLDKYRHKLN